MNAAAKRELVEKVPFWYHSTDFGDGFVSKGYPI